MMNLFKWQRGRQEGGYRVLPFLIQKRFDLYLIDYPVGAYIPPHRDPNPNGKHYRLNITLLKGEGGKFRCRRSIYSSERVQFFRPDENTHYVTPVTKGRRLVLSLGWIR